MNLFLPGGDENGEQGNRDEKDKDTIVVLCVFRADNR
jgi:hypothetical protein